MTLFQTLARSAAIAAALATVATEAAAQRVNADLLRAVLECRDRSPTSLAYATTGMFSTKPSSVVQLSPPPSLQREDWLNAADAKPFGLEGAVLHQFLAVKYEGYGITATRTQTTSWGVLVPASFEDTATAIATTFGTPICDRGVLPPAKLRLRPCSYKATAAHGAISMVSIEGGPAEIFCR